MGIAKSEIRVQLITEIGASMEDGAESAKIAIVKIDGGRRHIEKVKPLILQFHGEVDKDIESGKFDKFEEPLKVAALIKTYLTRAHSAVESYEVGLATERLMAVGRQQAMEKTVQNLSKLRESERRKLKSLQSAIKLQSTSEKSEDDSPRATGTHPGSTLKDRRLAEETAMTEKPAKRMRKTADKKKKKDAKDS